MSLDLESQIRLIADEAFAQTTTVDVDRRLVATARPPAESVTNKENVMLRPTPNPTPSPRRTRMLAVAASVVVIIAGVVAIALLRDDSEQAPVDPAPSTSVEAATTTTAASVDTAALAAVGERLMTAFDSGDSDTVAELVADDADPIAMIGVTTKSGLIDLFGYIEAADLGFQLRECVGSEPDQVRCELRQSSGFATAARVPPGESTMFLKIEDGQIVALRYGRPEGHGFAHDRFSSFIRETDPDATEKMWWSNSEGEPFPLLTEESFELFEQYLQEFIDSNS